jgi:hypothetical protein
MTSLGHFLAQHATPRGCHIATHQIGPASINVFLHVSRPIAGGPLVALAWALHRDHEGTWAETTDAGELVGATNEEDFVDRAAALRFPSGTPVVPNRFDELVFAAGDWFKQC